MLSGRNQACLTARTVSAQTWSVSPDRPAFRTSLTNLMRIS